jgi:hypothetical protein
VIVTSGVMLNFLVIPAENFALSQIHSSDLDGERNQLRQGLGTTYRTARMKSSFELETFVLLSALTSRTGILPLPARECAINPSVLLYHTLPFE